MKLVARSFALLLLASVATFARSQSGTIAPSTPPTDEAAPSGDYWRLIGSPATYHFHYSPDHRHVYMLGLERQHEGGFVWGGTAFRNSFGQPSAYVYAGRRFDNLTRYRSFFLELTGGVLYGYKPPFENKVPLNRHGFSPGAVLSTGWQLSPTLSTQLNFLGNSAIMLQLSVEFR